MVASSPAMLACRCRRPAPACPARERCGSRMDRGCDRRPRNPKPVAGRAPMTAIRSGGRRSPAQSDAPRGRRFEVEAVLDLERDRLLEPYGLFDPGRLLAGDARLPVSQLALSSAVRAAPARLVTWSSSAHRCPPCAYAYAMGQALATASFSAPRSLALRARRFRATSDGPGVTTPLVTRRSCVRWPQVQTGGIGSSMQSRLSRAKKRLTMRSSPEW